MHVDAPQLGHGKLRHVVARVLGRDMARETVRKILPRNQGFISVLEQRKRATPRRIEVSRPRTLWGVDLTLVWVLGF